MAIKGVAEFYEGSGKKHIVTTQTESAWLTWCDVEKRDAADSRLSYVISVKSSAADRWFFSLSRSQATPLALSRFVSRAGTSVSWPVAAASKSTRVGSAAMD